MPICVVSDLSATGLSLVDPQGDTPYDYELSVHMDLNQIFAPFKYMCNGDGTLTTWGEREAYTAFHKVLKGDEPEKASSWSTVYTKAGASAEAASWLAYWAGCLSEAINSNDTAGLSVKTDLLMQALDDPDTRQPANRISGSFNAALGDKLGGSDGATFGCPPEPIATQFYLAALARFLLGLRGFVSGSEGSVNADPTIEPASIALLEGDTLAFRMEFSVVSTVRGVIKVTQLQSP